MNSYAHGELVNEKLTDLNFIKQRIENKIDIFSDDKLIKLNIDSSFPKYLLKNKKKFEHLIL